MNVRDSSIVETTVANMDYDNPSKGQLERLEKYLDSNEKRARRMARRALEKADAIEFKLKVSKEELIEKSLAEEVVSYY